MRVRIELTPEEAQVAMNELREVTHSAALPNRYRALKTVIAVSVWIPIGFLWRYFDDVYGQSASWFYLGSVLLVAAAILGIRRIEDLKLNRYVESGELLEPAVYDFEQSGIVIDGGSIRSNVDWSGIKKVHDGNDFALLFLDKAGAIIVPKRLPEAGEIVSMASANMAGKVVD